MKTLLLFLAALVLVSGAAGASTPTPAKDRAKLKSMVLRPSEVPAGFSQVFSRLYLPAEIAAQGTWTAAQLKYWTYEGGYEVQFDRGSDGTDPSQISSDAGVYRTATGARRALAANAAACQRGLWSELPLDMPLGGAAHLCTLSTTLRGYDVQVFFVVWIVGRFKGAVTLTALKGETTADDALVLARLQTKRIVHTP